MSDFWENRAQKMRPLSPQPYFDASIYPHIFRRIMEFCSNSTLAVVLRCSNETFRPAVCVLYRCVRLSESQWWALLSIAIGKPMYDRRLTATIDNCSISMRGALAQIRHLTIISFWSGQLPQLPTGLLPRLQTLELVAPSYGNKPFDHSTLGPYPARHLIIGANARTHPSPLVSQYATQLSPMLDKFTLLIPPRITFETRGDLDYHGKTGDVTELVFLPEGFYSHKDRHQEDDEARMVEQLLSWARVTPATICVVGLEDIIGPHRASLFEQSYRRRAAQMCMQPGVDSITARVAITTYAAWRDSD